MTERIRICLIGTGRAGMIHGRNFAGRIKNAELIALCDPSKESLETAQKEVDCPYLYQDYHEALQNPAIDAVVIVTPTVYHKRNCVGSSCC